MNKKFKVAILSYPLMDPGIRVAHLPDYMDLDYHNADAWEVPLYIHIPFCSKICKFCVYSRQQLENNDILEVYLKALIQEIKMYAQTAYVKSLGIGAIFMGGGTPTCLSAAHLECILNICRDYLPLKPQVEITVECNVMNADRDKIQRLCELGVSRISAGIQTFNPRHREILGLRTSSADAAAWIQMASSFPFAVVSADLMYGLPNQTFEEWFDDLRMGLSMPVSHFSIYELYVMSGSRLYKEIQSGQTPSPRQELFYSMYLEADRLLKEKGFEHHIIPEYNLPGKKARFWELTYDGFGDNLAVGASSFGFINGVNYQNIPNVDDYIKRISDETFPVSMVSQKADHTQMMERTLVLGLRRKYIEKNIFTEQYGESIAVKFGDVIERLKHDGLLVETAQEYRLTPKGEYLQGDVSVMFMRSTFDGVSPLKKQLAIGKHVVPGAIRDLACAQ